MTDHPITPPPELVRQWVAKNYVDLPIEHVEVHLGDVKICTEAARWGADQELEACCEWLRDVDRWKTVADRLRLARRPKPPSLKEQALEMLECIPTYDSGGRPNGIDVSIIRRALEQLDD